jgi:hypothetical protein
MASMALLIFSTLILVSLPYGSAILFGVVSERWVGETFSRWSAVAGFVFGVYLVHKSFELILVH